MLAEKGSLENKGELTKNKGTGKKLVNLLLKAAPFRGLSKCSI
jgi:hypothetical protein